MIRVLHDPIVEALLSDTPCSACSPIDRAIMLEQRVQEAFDDQILGADTQLELDRERKECASATAELEDAEGKLVHYKRLLDACREWRDEKFTADQLKAAIQTCADKVLV